MRVDLKKCRFVATLAIMITFCAEKAMAFPLPTFDLKRIASGLIEAYYQVMEIKQEVDSNLRTIKEIVNGGYGAAAKDLFTSLKDGDFDRFGNSLYSMKSYAKQEALNFQTYVDQRQRAKELRSQGVAADVAKEQAKLEGSAKRVAIDNARKQAIRERDCYANGNCSGLDDDTAQRIRNMREKEGNFMQSSYDWLRENRTVTESAISEIDAIENENYGDMLGSALKGAGGAVNNETLGNIFTSSAESGDALNSVLSGDYGSALSHVGSAVGESIGSAGNEDNNLERIGNAVSGASHNTGNMYDSIMSGDWGEATDAGMRGASDALFGAGADVAGTILRDTADESNSLVRNAGEGSWGDAVIDATFGVADGLDGAANAIDNKNN